MTRGHPPPAPPGRRRQKYPPPPWGPPPPTNRLHQGVARPPNTSFRHEAPLLLPFLPRPPPSTSNTIVVIPTAVSIVVAGVVGWVHDRPLLSFPLERPLLPPLFALPFRRRSPKIPPRLTEVPRPAPPPEISVMGKGNNRTRKGGHRLRHRCGIRIMRVWTSLHPSRVCQMDVSRRKLLEH